MSRYSDAILEDCNYFQDHRVRAARARNRRDSRIDEEEDRVFLADDEFAACLCEDKLEPVWRELGLDEDEVAQLRESTITLLIDKGGKTKLGPWQVCPTCDGNATVVNPSIDCGGLGYEDFDDEDFAEGYFNGRYDIQCPTCRGRSTVRHNEPADDVAAFIYEWAAEMEAADGDYDAERYAEMRMGC